MRRTLAIWNKFQNSLEFAPGVDLDLLHFQVTRTFAFTGLGSGDFKLDVLQKLIKQFKSLLWAYGGVWSLGLTSEGYEVTLTAKCAAICPPLPKRKLTRIREFTTGANYVCALAGDDMTIKTHKQSVKYDSAKVEQLFAKTLNTAVWPTSFMLNYTSPVATLFAAHLETTFSKQKTLGFFGPCDTMRKRLKSNA
jgi:hypothetical protein